MLVLLRQSSYKFLQTVKNTIDFSNFAAVVQKLSAEATKMHPDILLLAERLVVAMERISEDVKNMSACVYDMSHCVSHLLNEKWENEDSSQPPCDDADNHPYRPSEVVLGSSAESEPSLQSELGAQRSVTHVHELDLEKISVQNVASMDIENSDILPLFNKRIKSEEQSEGGEIYDSFDLCYTNMNDGNSASDCTTRTAILPEGESLVAETHNIESASSLNSTEKPSQGTLCNTAFPTERASEVHKLQHSREKPYKCRECGKMFVRGGYFDEHMRTHVGQKVYKCTECGKVFYQSSKLNYHMRLHTGKRPFTCESCGNSFTSSSSLRCHRFIAHKEVPPVSYGIANTQ